METTSDPSDNNLDSIHLVQTKLVRFLNGIKISDRISTKMLMKNINMLSANQINEQIKLLEPKHGSSNGSMLDSRPRGPGFESRWIL